MSDVLSTPRFKLHKRVFNPSLLSEQLACDNPLAREIAESLFDAGLSVKINQQGDFFFAGLGRHRSCQGPTEESGSEHFVFA